MRVCFLLLTRIAFYVKVVAYEKLSYHAYNWRIPLHGIMAFVGDRWSRSQDLVKLVGVMQAIVYAFRPAFDNSDLAALSLRALLLFHLTLFYYTFIHTNACCIH